MSLPPLINRIWDPWDNHVVPLINIIFHTTDKTAGRGKKVKIMNLDIHPSQNPNIERDRTLKLREIKEHNFIIRDSPPNAEINKENCDDFVI